MDLDRILKVAVLGGASDIILKVGATPRFRYSGDMVPLKDNLTVTSELMLQWLISIVPERLRPKLETLDELDFAYQSRHGYRFRVNVFRQRQLHGMVLRVVSSHVRTMEELQLPKVIGNFAGEKRGLILVTGATGSGKSTTLAALIQKINAERAAHILTVEDPIEFHFQDAKSTINQREIGVDAGSFSAALRSAMRQNPDVILVGELRDRETIETALMAAETGHLVLSTLHTQDAVETMTRIMSFFPPDQHAFVRMLLASTLRSIISQRLVPRRNTQGMIAAFEIMVANAMVRDVILKSPSFHAIQDAIREGQKTYGMQTFDQSLLALYEAGAISREQALAQASQKNDMMLRLNGIA